MCLCGLYLSFLAKRQKKGNLSDLFIYKKKGIDTNKYTTTKLG